LEKHLGQPGTESAVRPQNKGISNFTSQAFPSLVSVDEPGQLALFGIIYNNTL